MSNKFLKICITPIVTIFPTNMYMYDGSQLHKHRSIDTISGRKAFIGIGFGDRGDAFDLNVALQDHFK